MLRKQEHFTPTAAKAYSESAFDQCEMAGRFRDAEGQAEVAHYFSDALIETTV
jgi:hypothetical protein